MKTLKKTLCLVLAVVMVLGLGVISASATLEYADNDSITYAEAVDVMSGIGVLIGDESGFRPTDTVRRNEAAKILAYIMIGDSKQADALSTTTDPFTDVPATDWAAGYIAYCVNAGVINGMGDGTFQPYSPVTGLQFAKMLLCALGYNANDEYVNNDWTISVSKDALRLGIFEDNPAGASNTPATREECALYAFNTVAGGDVKGLSSIYSGSTTSGTGAGVRKYTGIQKVSYSALLGGYITANTFSGTDSPDANKGITFAADFELVKENHEPDPFYRMTGHHWYVKRSTNVVTADYDADKDLKAVYTTPVTGSDIYNLLGSSFINYSNVDLEVYVNGRLDYEDSRYEGGPTLKTDSATIFALENFTKNNTKEFVRTGNGVLTYVYAWDYTENAVTTNNIRIVIVDTFLAQVTDVKAGTTTKDPVTTVKILKGLDDDGNDVFYTNTNFGIGRELDSKGFNTDAFAEDDYVLITATVDGEIQSMVAPTIVTSNVTRYNKSGKTITITANGTQYVAAKNTATDNDLYAANDGEQVSSKELVDGDQHTLYVDEYGYVISVADVAPDSNYVYVAQFGRKTDTSDNLLDDNVLVADIYYSDGSHGIVNINLDRDKEGREFDDDKATSTQTGDNSKGDLNYIRCAYQTDGTLDWNGDRTGKPTLDALNDRNSGYLGVYELNMVRGAAVLTKPGTAAGGANVTKGISTIAGVPVKANEKTVFYYINFGTKGGGGYGKDDYSVTVYTGINNVPISDPLSSKTGGPEAGAHAYISGPKNGKTGEDVIKALEVWSDFKAGTTDTVYFYTGNSYDFLENSDGTYNITYQVFVDGVEQELTLTYKTKEDAQDADKRANDEFKREFFTVRENEKNEFVEVGIGDPGSAKADKINELFYNYFTIKKGDIFDSTTILNLYSYTANTAKFLDIRDLDDEDDRYNGIAALQRDFADKELYDDLTFAVLYADNASNQISAIYLVLSTPPVVER